MMKESLLSRYYAPRRNAAGFEAARAAYNIHCATRPDDAYLDAVPDADYDASEAEYTQALTAWEAELDRLSLSMQDTITKRTKPSTWELEFLTSFELCKSRQISAKQADILCRMGEVWDTGRYTKEYRFQCGRRVYTIITDGGRGNYLSVRGAI